MYRYPISFYQTVVDGLDAWGLRVAVLGETADCRRDVGMISFNSCEISSPARLALRFIGPQEAQNLLKSQEVVDQVYLLE